MDSIESNNISKSISIIYDSQCDSLLSIECGQRMNTPNEKIESQTNSHIYSPAGTQTSTPNSNPRPKRTLFTDSLSPIESNTIIPKRHKSQTSNMSSTIESLQQLEYIKSLCILNYIKTYKSDPLVTEYIDSLLEYPEFCPIVPKEETIFEYADLKLNFDPPDELLVQVTTNFMSYFQLSYFKNHVVNATKEGKTMFNPKCDFFVPQFPLLPEQTLNDFTKAKKALVFHYQDYAVQGATFTKELLLIRIIKAIKDFVISSSPDSTDSNPHIKLVFSKCYLKSKVEFAKKYKIKNIDWTQRDDKVRHTVPFWRKQTIQIPPTKAVNKYAEALSEEIRAGKASFESKELKHEYMNFFDKPNSIIAEMNKIAQSSANELNYRASNGLTRTSSRTPTSNPPVFPGPSNRYTGQKRYFRGQRRSNTERGRGSFNNFSARRGTQGWNTNQNNIGFRRRSSQTENGVNIRGSDINHLID